MPGLDAAPGSRMPINVTRAPTLNMHLKSPMAYLPRRRNECKAQNDAKDWPFWNILGIRLRFEHRTVFAFVGGLPASASANRVSVPTFSSLGFASKSISPVSSKQVRRRWYGTAVDRNLHTGMGYFDRASQLHAPKLVAHQLALRFCWLLPPTVPRAWSRGANRASAVCGLQLRRRVHRARGHDGGVLSSAKYLLTVGVSMRAGGYIGQLRVRPVVGQVRSLLRLFPLSSSRGVCAGRAGPDD
eukprot:4685257-Pleurochrysis_carterae.AAC.1